MYLLISNIVLWLAVLGLLAVVIALTRQVGVLHERITPAGVRTREQGPKIGDPLPTLELAALDGTKVRLGPDDNHGKSTLLFFLGPMCPVCKSLLPVLRSRRKKEHDWLNIVLASDGDLPAQRRFVEVNGLSGFAYLVSSPLAIRLGIGQLPYIVLADETGVIRARGLVDSREQLERIFDGKERGVSSIQDFLDRRSEEAA